MLNNISKTYLEKYGTKINTKAINHLFQKSKIYDNEHIYISGNFKSLKNFQKHILQATSWRIMKYSHYGLYTKDNNYFAILLKRYLFLKQIGFQKNDVFIISGETDPGVKSVMAYFQNLKGEVFHVLPSIKANSFFQFKFSKQIEETSPAFELVVETIFDGRRVANIIRKNNVLTANLKINYPHPKDAENYLLKKINDERVSRGIKPLEPDQNISKIALKHSKLMAKKQRVFHSNLSKEISRLNSFYSNISENVGSSRHISSIHNGFLTSPAHFKNIVNDSFSKVGIGVTYKTVGNEQVIYVTQVFLHPHNEISMDNFNTDYFLNFININRRERGLPPLVEDKNLLHEASLFIKKENKIKKLTSFLSLSNSDLKRIAYNRIRTQSLFSITNNPALYEKDFTHLALLLPAKNDLTRKSLLLLASYKK